MSFSNLAAEDEALNPSYAGTYITGRVVVNVDPLGLDRIVVTVPGLYEGPVDTLPWVLPIKPNAVTGQGSGFGTYGAPAVGASVVILLQNGDPHYPAYIGGLHTVTNAFFPSGQSWGFQDAYGNQVRFSASKEIVLNAAAGATVTISPTGTVTVSSPQDVNISAAGTMNLSSGGDMNLTAGGDTVIEASKIFFKRG